jgi:hypothetical protein
MDSETETPGDTETDTGGADSETVLGDAGPGMGLVLISEVSFGDLDYVELYNAGDAPVELEGWVVEFYGRNANNGQLVTTTYELPEYTLEPGSYVTIRDERTGGGGPGPDINGNEIQYNDNIRWDVDDPGAVAVLDPDGAGVDFMRFNGVDYDIDVDPPAGLEWTESIELSSEVGADEGLSRVPEDQDSDDAADSCIAPPSQGEANEDCA